MCSKTLTDAHRNTLDVIGDWLTEVNVTSPTCFREIQDQTGFDVAVMFMDALESVIR